MDNDQSDNLTTPRLLKYKRNGIIEAIRKVGLEPKEFNLDEDEDKAWVKHNPSSARFTISGNPSKYSVTYAVGDWPASQVEKYTWGGVMSNFDVWLYDLKNDLETPDLWAELQGEAALFEAAPNAADENTLFNQQEKKEISTQLRKLSKQAQSAYSLSETQMLDLNTKLDYLIEASDRLGRIDWREVFVGVVMSFVLSAALPPETARAMFVIFFQGIKTILLSGA